jgi:predicted AAA+ superfamily ATPase
LQDYIAFLEGTYFIKTIRPYSSGRNSEIRKMPKVYTSDTGFANHFARLDYGALFENSVFQNLRMHGELNYYRKKTGVEIDFIIDQKRAYEVKESPQRPDVKRLHGLVNGLDLGDYKVVSKNYVNLEDIIYGFMLGRKP